MRQAELIRRAKTIRKLKTIPRTKGTRKVRHTHRTPRLRRTEIIRRRLRMAPIQKVPTIHHRRLGRQADIRVSLLPAIMCPVHLKAPARPESKYRPGRKLSFG